MTYTTTYRKLVMPKDLNPANRLFGGALLLWADEAASLYVMCQTGSHNIVTLKISEVLFKLPVFQGDFLIFDAKTIATGTTSLTVELLVKRKNFDKTEDALVFSCNMVFVTIDPATGKAIPHGLEMDKNKSQHLLK